MRILHGRRAGFARPAGRLRRSRPKIALGAAGALIAGTVAVLAVRDPGYVAQSVDLTRSVVWVTNESQLLVGRVNRQIDELDSAVRVPAKGFDVYQNGDAVLTVDSGKHELRPIDPVSVTLAGRIKLPASAAVAFGDGVLAIADEASGKVWSGTLKDLASLDPESTPPTATTAPGVAVTVSQNGTVFGAAPGSASLWTIKPGADSSGAAGSVTSPAEVTGSSAATATGASGAASGAPSESATPDAAAAPGGPSVTKTDLAGGALSPLQSGQANPISVTAVGDVPAVLDIVGGTLRLPDRSVQVPDAGSAVLQQPGPAADSVLVATSAALLRVSSKDGHVDTVIAGRSGAPAAPVLLDGCVHSAWSSQPAIYGLACGKSTPSVREVPGHTGSAAMVFRVNRHTIVLNDVATGSVWAAEDTIRLINNWDQVQPLSDDQDDSKDTPGADGLSTQLATPKLNCISGAQVTPPAPQDDAYGVRAGRSTVLRVLENDASDNCSMTVITSVSGWGDDSAGLQVATVDSGQALQVTVPSTATGTLPVLTYHVSDGLGHQADARVTVAVAPPDEHKPAVKIRGSSVPVESLGTVSYNVLDDYVSPTGDDLYLASASIDGGDEVTFQPNGLITFADKGVGGAIRKTVDFQIADDGGDELVAGKLTVDVRPEGTSVPVTSPVYARAVVGQAKTVDILSDVTAPSLGAAQLAAVTPVDKAAPPVGVIHPDAGTVTITGASAGTFYYIYQVKAGEKSAEGLLRLDVAEQSTNPEPPSGVTDVVYLPEGGVTTLDPTANDVDPSGAGLAVTQVQPDDTLSATVQSMQTVTISARSARALQEARGGAITYTVSNGYGSASGLIRVVPVPAQDRLAPIARGIDATVRAGDAITIPIAGYAYDPTGDVISLTALDTGTVPAGSGVLFHTKSAIRFLAPVAAPAKPLHFAYTVTNSAGLSATGGVTIQFDLAPAGQNHPPSPPQPVVARVFTGASVSIPLPLSGIDPDGDWVTLTQVGAHSSGPLGDAVASGLSSIAYTAGPSAGPDSFTYTASDPSGATVTGQVTVLVVDPPPTVQPPSAPDLHVTARPGRTVAVDVVKQIAAVNSAQELALGDPAFVAPPNWTVKADAEGGRILVTTPKADTVGTIKYTVVNQLGLAASGIITLTVSATDPLDPPTAADIVVDPATVKPGQTTVDVPVPDDKLTNPSGTLTDLTLSLDPQSAAAGTVSGRTVTVKLTSTRQVLAYRATNTENAFATAFIVVPAANTTPLTVQSTGPALSVKAGEALTIDIATSLRADDGVALTIPNGSKVSVSGGGDIGRVDATHIRYTAPKTGKGLVYVSLSLADEKGRTAAAQLSVTVIPTVIPAPVVKDSSLQVEVGKTATLDLAAFVTAGNADQQKLLKYAISGGGSGLQASLAGSKLTVTAALTAKGARATLTLTATDGQGKSDTGAVTVQAVASKEPLLRVSDATVDDGRPGKASVVDVLSHVTYNPFDKAPTIVAQGVQSGSGLVSVAGGSLNITPSKVGTVVVSYTLRDATGDSDRDVSGTVTVTVKDKPDKPGTPTVVSMASRTVTIKWTLPKDNGSPITGYRVSDGATGFSQPCPTSPCTLTSLTNGTAYSFSVVATNAIGDSEPSVASASVTPDTAPNTPAPPVLTWLDGQQALQVGWTDPGSDGTPISAYDIEISPADAKGASTVTVGNVTSYTWPNLKFGTTYTFKLRAHNASKDPSGWSPSSAPETPSTKATAPRNVAVSFGPDNYSPGGNTLSVAWAPPENDGGNAVAGYLVKYTSTAGNGTITITDPTQLSTPIQGVADGVTYAVTVTATNRSGPGAVSNAPTAKPFSPPGTPSSVTANAGNQTETVTVTWNAATSHGRSIDHYEISRDGRSPASVTGTSYTSGALPIGVSTSYQVRACYSAQDASFNTCGPWSSGASATPYGPVGSVQNRSANGGTKQISFNWDAPASNGRPSMHAEYSTNGGSSWHTGTSYTWTTGSCASESFAIQVRGYDSLGNRGPTNTISGSTTDSCPPPPSVNVYKSSHVYSGNMYYVWIDVANYPANVAVTCGADYSGWNVNPYKFNTNGAGNGGFHPTSTSTNYWFSGTGNDVTVTCSGGGVSKSFHYTS